MSFGTKPLGEVGYFQAGNGFPKKYQGKTSGDFPFAKVGDISQCARADKVRLLSAGNYVDSQDVLEIKGKLIPENAILFAKIGEAIKLNNRALSGCELLIDNNSMAFVCDPKQLDFTYAFYFFRQLDLYNYAGKTTVPALRKSDLDLIEIPLPPLAEQKRIAAILDKADTIRQKRKQAIDLADEFQRSVFLDMFGQQLSSRSNVVKFGDITVLDAKMVDPKEEQYLDMLHIGPDRIEKVNGQLLPAMTAREEMLISKKFLFDEKYVLYSKIRPYLRKAAVPDFSALCSADMYPVKPIEGKATREFVWMLLLSDFFDSYVSSLPNRANIPKLNKSELAAFEFSLPTYREIAKFSGIAKKIKSNRIALSGGLKDATNFFNALSQKTFSGEL